jgi:hypothetical protein
MLAALMASDTRTPALVLQMIKHRIGRHVHQLVDHGVATNQPHDAGLLRRPK